MTRTQPTCPAADTDSAKIPIWTRERRVTGDATRERRGPFAGLLSSRRGHAVRPFVVLFSLAGALGLAACHSPGAIPKSSPRPPDDALAGKGEPCQTDDDCAGDKLVCDAGECINWMRMAGPAPEISPEELAARSDAGQPLQIVDVRTGPEFRGARIAGARHVPISRLADELPELGLDPAIPVDPLGGDDRPALRAEVVRIAMKGLEHHRVLATRAALRRPRVAQRGL